MEIKITHVADCQVKSRNKNLETPTKHNLQEIENYVRTSKSQIHVIAGDLFEFATPNEIERKLIYEHILNLLKIDSLKELVIIAGNHDIVKEKKKELEFQNNIQPNAISIFTDVLNSGLEVTDKLRYFSNSGVYNSSVSDRIRYIVYSREDQHFFDWNTLKDSDKLVTEKGQSTVNICLYHAMIQEYVDYDKIPLSPNAKSKLDTLKLFPTNSIVLAGDIHRTLIFEDKQGEFNRVKFIYPGSTLQQTYKEGAYLPKSSESKYIMCYEFDDNRYQRIDNIQIYNEPLENYVCYNTIALDNNFDANNNFELFKERIKTLEFGLDKTYLKIKSNNSLISLEKDIREYVDKLSNQIIVEFDYDKFVQPETFIDNTVVNEIYESKKQEIIDSTGTEAHDLIISGDNIDKLLLNKEQLNKLFGNILQSSIDKLTVEDVSESAIQQQIMDLFSSELNNVLDYSADKRYNIKFERIVTNNFMYLGSNDIQLDLPNITRIIGTNGIGKTTLYRMIRWAITGELFDGMQSNRVVQNNLLLFNTNKPDLDTVVVDLYLTINYLKIHVRRHVTRVWKQNVTEEQKSSVDWKDYVSNLERDFMLRVGTDLENDYKEYLGESAEKQLKSWFGNTIETILFLNQAKLYSLLNTKPAELNELILNYIGVDYLKTLENRLDSVKDFLLSSVSKPKRKGEEIVADKKFYLKKIESLKSELTEYQTKDDSIKEQLNQHQKEIDSKNEELISLGDIPNIIKENKIKQDKLQNMLDNEFKNISEKKEIPEFKEQKPDETKFNSDKVFFEKREAEIQAEQEKLDLKVNELESIKPKLINIVHNIIESINEQETINEDKKKQVETEISNEYQLLIEKLRIVENQVNHEINEIQIQKENKLSKLEQIESKIKELEEQIKSGVCPTCGKPFEDDFDNFKSTSEKKIHTLNDAIDKIKSEINEFENRINGFKPRKEQTQVLINACVNKNNDSTTFEALNKFFERDTYCDSLIEKFKELETLKKIDFSDKIRCGNVLLTFETPEIVFDEFKQISEKISAFNSKKNLFSDMQKDIQRKSNELKTERERCILDFNKQQQEFIDKQTQHNKSVQEIIDYNNNIERLIFEKQKVQEDLLSLINQTSNLESSELIKYNNIRNQIIEIKTKLEELNNILESSIKKSDELKSNIYLFENQVNNLQSEYDNYIQYVSNNAVWKIYSKLIKTTFKEIIFDYYRNYLNNTLNYLLSDVSFKLYWNNDSELTMVHVRNGIETYQSVKQSSGMETTFLGLALIYTIHILNVKNQVSHIFIDEISGTLNKGHELSYSAENYQELFVKILSKFTEKSVWIVDHAVEDLHESNVYEVVPNDKDSKYIKQ